MVTATELTQRVADERAKRKAREKAASGSGTIINRASTVVFTNTRTGMTTTTVTDQSGKTSSIRTRRARRSELKPQLGPTVKTVTKEQLISRAPRTATPSGREQALKQQRLAFITASLTRQQEDKLFKKLNAGTQAELFKIDKRKDLNVIEKNEAKRKLIGIVEPGTSGIQKKVKVLEEFRKGVKKDLADKIQSNALKNKIVTGSVTITPAEIRQLNIDINKGKLTKAQLNAARRGIFFGANLVGGLIVATGEIILFPLKLAQAGYNYGVNAVKRAEAGRTSTINVFGTDLLKLNKTLFETRKFIQENPKEALAILGTVAALVGGQLLKNYKADPGRFIGKVIAYVLVPGQIKKLLKKLPAVQPLLEAKASSTSIKSTQDLVTGKTVITGEGAGVFKNGKKFTNSFKLTLNPKTGKITGTLITKVGRKTVKQSIKLVDEGAYYVDKASGLRISKVRLPITSRKVKVVKETINNVAQTDVINAKFSGKKNVADVLREVINIADNKRVTTEEVSKILQLTKDSKILAETKKILTIVSKTTRARLPKQLTPTQVRNLEKFLKLIKYDKKVLGKFVTDRRTRVAIALGLRKDSKLLTGLAKIVDKNGKVIQIVRQKGKAESTALLRQGTFKVKGKRVSLKRNKKGQTSLLEDDTIKILGKTNKRFATKNVITIPRITSKLPLTKTNLKFYGVLGLFLSATKTIKDVLTSTTVQDFKKINERVSSFKRDIKTIQTKIKLKDQIKVPTQKRVTTTKQTVLRKTKQIPRTRTITKPGVKQITKPARSARGFKTTTPPKTITKLPSISWDFNKKSDKVLVFDIVFRERRSVSKNFNKKSNPVIVKSKKVTTTRNRALNMAAQMADYKTIRSIDVKLVGVTKRKLKEIGLDKRIKKFTPNRTSRVLKFVEKAKYAIDSRPEKKELKSRKKRKPIKKKRKSKK